MGTLQAASCAEEVVSILHTGELLKEEMEARYVQPCLC